MTEQTYTCRRGDLRLHWADEASRLSRHNERSVAWWIGRTQAEERTHEAYRVLIDYLNGDIDRRTVRLWLDFFLATTLGSQVFGHDDPPSPYHQQAVETNKQLVEARKWADLLCTLVRKAEKGDVTDGTKQARIATIKEAIMRQNRVRARSNERPMSLAESCPFPVDFPELA